MDIANSTSLDVYASELQGDSSKAEENSRSSKHQEAKSHAADGTRDKSLVFKLPGN
jgi:hypothetical protein